MSTNGENMRSRDEVLREFGLAPEIAGIPEQMMADRIRELEARAKRMERVVEAADATFDTRTETEEWEAHSRLMRALDELHALPNMKNI